MQKPVQTPPSRTRRLQRDKDFTGGRLSSFREVFLRHGLPGLALAVLCFAVPGLPMAFLEGLARGLASPGLYVGGFVIVFSALAGYAYLVDGRWSFARLGWVVYLGALSFWEEWVFRLAMPHMLEGAGASVWLAAGLSALVFGGAHYFTLRWKLQWCVGAVIGSLLLSRQMQVHEDLLLISAFHWIATLLNTPRPPGQTG